MTAPDSRLGRWTVALAIAVMLAAHADPLAAQYFGRNRVQYDNFNFQVLKTEHFDIYYYEDEEAATRDAARMAERWYARLSRILDHRFESRQPVVFYGSHPAFQQTSTTGSDLGEGTQAFVEPFKQRLVMPLTGSYQETDHVLGHEMVHAFQYDIAGFGQGAGGLEAAARRFNVPLWFAEGMAEYLSGGPVDPNAAMTVRDGALSGRIPTIEQLTYDPRFFPYTWGHSFWAYIAGRWGDAVIGQILKQVGQGVPYPEAFERILNTPLEEIGEDWASAIRRAYLPLLAERPEAREIAKPLITERTEGGRLNLGPSVSPDGRYVAFMSERSGFDIEVFLADAETGEVIRRLQKGTAFDPHFQSLRFINSAGTWSPDGRQFAFAALRGGRDVLVILDAERADIEREIRIPNVSEITTPAWSPDGRTIVFAGIEGGVSDLYAFDLQTNETQRLTSDLFADLHPNYSPDGRSIAFVTDQGAGADLGTLEYGGYRLAVFDLATRQTRLVTTGAEWRDANDINPVWTRDGSGLYFISDRTGIPNLYRLELQSGQVFQLTRLFGGVSGITDVSPAISAARNADRVLFTAFERNGYNIYALSTPEELAGVIVSDTAAISAPDSVQMAQNQGAPLPAVLPPVPRPAEAAFNRVATIVDDPRFGLPTAEQIAAWEVVPYRPRLTLDYLGQPQVGVSVGGGTFGRSGVYGGIAGIFSDVLGRHTVFGAVQAQGQLDEIGFSTVYLYRRNRWNYGAAVQRVPSVYGFFQQGLGEDNTIRQRLLRYRIFDSSLQGLAQYPFSRVQRVEFSAGARRLAQDVQVYERVFDRSGLFLGDRQFDESMESYNLLEASAALVYDNALFGYTSPFAGQRYRFEISPTLGSLQFVQALADYRRYFFLRPLTIAVRGVHFGRYGADEQSNLFGRGAFLGYPSLVRGYNDVYSDCRSRGGSCEVLDQLLGSRIAVANAELRFPLIRQLVLGVPTIALPPIEGIAFVDAGVAWGRTDDGIDTRPVFRRGIQFDNEGNVIPRDRGFVTSAGVGARINLFGYFILEADYVNGFERDRGWHWQFALQPGF